ncbi:MULTISPECIES: acyl-CoA desaturase [Legionella]|uniref:Acyl-CoA desaturase n=1 Tax=Legionella resiliens TaxID=2905958 RepID=A0ABS8X5E2_9GAMM|nr:MULTISPECIES: acyl-CoA desaturase [unclassified Legionella]MCE0724834.1 acyl-CoA desaturase [Legionella sp. 9fVS26]MCE3533988.1 acyl-CoA desaturase [Legionella sp. 8cVS16]QLZ70223.1 acyl-CoA desaturase [Legionella sp. PC1000]
MKFKSLMFSVHGWFDSGLKEKNLKQGTIHWARAFLFILVHLCCFAVFWVGWSFTAVFTAIFLFYLRMFAITGFYHRYFSHKTFKMNRFWQFIFAVLGNSAAQRGPLWWAGHHRLHHRYTEEQQDPHSPIQHGFLWSHVGWIFYSDNFKTDYKSVRDFAKYPELLWLNRYDNIVPICLILILFAVGTLLEAYYPDLHTSGMQLVIWGFFISTVALFHATFSINSVSHLWGTQTFQTEDKSRNNFLLALLTMGEGWHNNHHYYPRSTSQGFRWWQIDITYYLLCGLEKIKVIYEINKVPLELKKSKVSEQKNN